MERKSNETAKAQLSVADFTRLRRKPRLSVLRSGLLRRVDKVVEECAAGVLRSLVGYFGGVGSAGSAEEATETTAVKPRDSNMERVACR